MKRILYLFGLLIMLGSCQPVDQVKFQETQPTDVKKSNGFRMLRRGKYINYKNPKKSIQIYKTYITLSREYYYKANRNTIEIGKLAKVDRGNDSAMIAFFSQHGNTVIIENDTVHISKTVTDTVFMINENNFLKHYKKSYYLNYKTDDNFWNVYRVKFRGDSLLYGEITPSDTLLSYNYAQIDTMPHDPRTKNYILNPDKKELRALMRSNAFKVTEKYIKE